MAKATTHVIHALRCTAKELSQRVDYQWGHMGLCNCGFLAQQITHLQKNEIHQYAMQRCGDWQEQLNDYCSSSGLAMDHLITALLDYGFDIDDLKHLERLSDRKVLAVFGHNKANLRFNVRTDVVRYLNAWADLLECQLLEEVRLPEFESFPVEI